MLLQFRDILKNRLNVDDIVTHLCSHVTNWLHSLKRLDLNHDDFTVNMKAAGFHLKLLESLILKYSGYYNQCWDALGLMLVSLSGLPGSAAHYPSLSNGQRDVLLRNVWIAAECLIMLLVGNPDFCGAMLNLGEIPLVAFPFI